MFSIQIAIRHSVLLITAGLALSCASSKQANKSVSFASNPVVAHRGAFLKNKFPENSIASLKEAIRLGSTGSEFDVRMTIDDSLVINHDPAFQKLVIDKTIFADLSKLSLSNGEAIPTLSEYLQAGLTNNKTTRLVLEIKPSDIGKERAVQIVTKVLATVKATGASSKTVYISFDYEMLKTIHQLDPKAITQYLNGDKSPEQLAKDGINGLDYHFSVFQKKPEWITEAKKLGLILNAWTVNDPAIMDWLIKEGFDFITTNEPELLLQKIAAK
jgi:glycerophosphoryl diester phosphodiesterase